jgi:arginase
MRFELVGVPYTSMAQPGGIARAIKVLRTAGLVDRLQGAGDVRDAGDLDLIEGDGRRGASGLLNEAALGRLVAATRSAVVSSHDRGRLPMLVGGDCPVLLGALAAIRDRHGSCGLMLIDGHEDAWPPSLSPTGEASDSEVGMALGLVHDGLPEPLAGLIPLLTPDGVVMLGPRDREEIHAGGAASLNGTVAMCLDDAAIKAKGAPLCADRAVATIGRAAPAFWLHLDLDVLSTEEFAAVDYPQPGGLTWPELREISVPTLMAPRCAGLSIAIYNPDRDQHGTDAERVVRFAADLVAAARETSWPTTPRR